MLDQLGTVALVRTLQRGECLDMRLRGILKLSVNLMSCWILVIC